METAWLVDQIKKISNPLKSMDDIDPLIEAIGEARYVLLGEATHGTAEFYTLRTEISKRLIGQKNFKFIAVEGDWPSCYSLNRYIKNKEGQQTAIQDVMLREFNRWPSWMWANRETVELCRWLAKTNLGLQQGDKIGFYGLDVYSLWESMEEIIRYLESIGSDEVESAKRAYQCFEPFRKDSEQYALSASFLSETCEDEVVQLLIKMQDNREKVKGNKDKEAGLAAELNALVAVDAEKYYRSMVRGGPDSWNIRDRHMVEALDRLMKFHGPEAKVIVWEHNTHIGDARATDMKNEGLINVGQLLREKHTKDQVFSVGFGTQRGTVIAAKEWGAPFETMDVPEAKQGSWEDLLHRAGEHDKFIIFKEEDPVFHFTLDHRAIGVVYRAKHEWGNYVPTVLSERYDAFVYVDRSHALHPLVLEHTLK
ncbi:MAG TPA: erythromycin esterase family protein [Bacilli bacterium]